MRKWMLLLMSLLVVSCATTPPSGASMGLVRLDVEPATAVIWVDGEYLGQVDGWIDHTIRIRLGTRRIELQANGYMTQRFDIDVTKDEEVTLRLTMQPEWDDGDEKVPEEL